MNGGDFVARILYFFAFTLSLYSRVVDTQTFSLCGTFPDADTDPENFAMMS
jgi:hypothetical protein